MRVHQSQINLNAQLDAMYAAQKANAKREAERTRKKLLDFASIMAGEALSESHIAKFGEDSEGRGDQGHQQKHNTLSDWA